MSWKPVLNFEQTIAPTADWYRDFQCGYGVVELGDRQILDCANRLP